ncbi:MAG: serine/threonine protein kinase [Deltaproteobacteria bacterium]|nr:serine/threonine protein kinase [Deltaproteobacteria bacterium]
MSEPRRVAEVPERIGQYRVLRELASGGMGKVFIAQRDGDPGVCVLKKLHVEMELHHTAGLRFQREAQLASLIDHPNVARLNRSGVEDGKFCIEMEYIAGHTVADVLRALLEAGRLPPYELSVNVVLGVLDAVGFAHELRAPDGRPLEIVHRDLTPRNVMLSYDGDVKVIDFGIARGRVDDFRTAPGSIFGTMTYASPEQATGQEVDRRSDLYTIGTVLFELLTGRPLIIESKFEDVLRAATRDPAPLITSVNPDAPRGLEAVVARALQKDREKRFQTAREFGDAIREGAPELARPVADLIGEFMREWFPEQEEKTQAGILRRGPILEPTEVMGPDLPTVVRRSATATPATAELEDMPATRIAGVGTEGTLVVRKRGSRLPAAPEQVLRTLPTGVSQPPRSKVPIFALAGGAFLLAFASITLFVVLRSSESSTEVKDKPAELAPTAAVGATAAPSATQEESPPPPPPPAPPDERKARPKPEPAKKPPPPPEPPAKAKPEPPPPAPSGASRLRALRQKLVQDPSSTSFDRVVDEIQKVAASLPANRQRELGLKLDKANNTLETEKLIDALDYAIDASR